MTFCEEPEPAHIVRALENPNIGVPAARIESSRTAWTCCSRVVLLCQLLIARRLTGRGWILAFVSSKSIRPTYVRCFRSVSLIALILTREKSVASPQNRLFSTANDQPCVRNHCNPHLSWNRLQFEDIWSFRCESPLLSKPDVRYNPTRRDQGLNTDSLESCVCKTALEDTRLDSGQFLTVNSAITFIFFDIRQN